MWRILVICVGALTVTLTMGLDDDMDSGSAPDGDPSMYQHTVYNFRPSSIFTEEGRDESRTQDNDDPDSDDKYRSYNDRFQDFQGGQKDHDRPARPRPPAQEMPNPSRPHSGSGRPGQGRNEGNFDRSREDRAPLDRFRPDQRKYYYGPPSSKAPPVQPRGAARKPSWKEVDREEIHKKRHSSDSGHERSSRDGGRNESGQGRSLDSDWEDEVNYKDVPRRRPTHRTQTKLHRKDVDRRESSTKSPNWKEVNHHGRSRDSERPNRKGKRMDGPPGQRMDGVFVMHQSPMDDRRHRDHHPRSQASPPRDLPVNDFIRKPPGNSRSSHPHPRVQNRRPQSRSDSGLSDHQPPYGKPEEGQGAGIGIVVSRTRDTRDGYVDSESIHQDRHGPSIRENEEDELYQSSRKPWGAFGQHQSRYQEDESRGHRPQARHQQRHKNQNYRDYRGDLPSRGDRPQTGDSGFLSKRLEYQPPMHKQKQIYDVYHHY